MIAPMPAPAPPPISAPVPALVSQPMVPAASTKAVRPVTPVLPRRQSLPLEEPVIRLHVAGIDAPIMFSAPLRRCATHDARSPLPVSSIILTDPLASRAANARPHHIHRRRCVERLTLQPATNGKFYPLCRECRL